MTSIRHPMWLGLCLALGLSSTAWAQAVFKCTVAGKAVYQATPCAGQGKELAIEPGPSEQEVQQAKARADAQRARSAESAAPAQGGQGTQAPAARPVDCAKLNKDRGDAFGRRNATVRNSRDTNIDQSAAVSREQDRIRAIERQMAAGGCKTE